MSKPLKSLKKRSQLPELLNELGLTGFGIELGVAAGLFSSLILKKSQLQLLFSVDLWGTRCHDDEQYKAVVDKLSEFGQRNAILRLSFSEAARLFRNDLFDFIYVDGNARKGQEGGKTLHEWWPKLKSGGIFAGHDYDKEHWPYNVEMIDAFVEEHHLTPEDRFSSWYCQKGLDRRII